MIKKKQIACLLLTVMVVSAVFSSNKVYPKVKKKTMTEEGWLYPGYSYPYKGNEGLSGEPVLFPEVWGYVMTSRLKEYDETTPLTDIGLFAAEIDSNGHLVSIPKRSQVKNFKGKVHLVAICESRSLSHFILEPKYDLRKKLINELIAASKDFDGLQIDYELVNKADSDNFHSFLKELKKALKGKELTVCVPARVKTLKNDTYDYKTLSEIVDRIMIMAYDEHWTKGPAGSIASMDWCIRIADYAKTIMEPSKYIIGIPFYGRTWVDGAVPRALGFNGMNRQAHQWDIDTIERENGIPYYTATVKVKVTGWFEDATSVVERARMYQDKGYTSIAFWRMGNEDEAVWEWIGNTKSGTKPLK